MGLDSILKKVLSVTLAVAFVLQQGSFAFATNVDNWSDLRTYVSAFSGDYNVTEPLTASDSYGTLYVTSNGRTVSGYSLTENSLSDTLISVNSGVTFGLGNTIYGSIQNNGTLNYSGSLLGSSSLSRSITGSGNLNLLGSSLTNYNSISQGAVSVGGYTSLTNNASVTATSFSNSGTVDNNAAITASITNNGTLSSSASDLIGTVANNGNLTLEGGNVQNTISGTGNTSVTGNTSSNYTITQNSVAVSNDAVFTNNAMLLASANVASGSSLSSDPDHLGKNVTNNGTLNLNGDGTLSVTVSGTTGTTNINGDLDNQSTISQQDITVASGKVVTTNASNMTASNAITNDGIIHYTAGTTGNTINGSGRVDITGYVTNSGDITQDKVSNSGVFTNNGTVAANLTNTNEIVGTGSIATGTGISSNSGTISQASLTNNGTFDNNGHITLTGALTNNSTFNTNADLISAAGGVVNDSALNITGGTNTNAITGGGTTSFTNNVTNSATIAQALVNNSGNLTNNALITADVVNSGTLTTDGTNIAGDVANTGSYILSNGNNANAITGTGTTSILGTTTNSGTITQDKVVIGNAGSLTTAANTVSAAVENQGDLTWNGGGVNNNIVTGNGDLTISGTNILNTASISQNYITINGDAGLSSEAGILTAANGLINYGDLTLTGGTNNNEIFGTGDLDILGDVTNNALIEQNTINVALGKFTTNAGALATYNGIVNDSEISLTGGDNNNDITGSGMTYIDGTVQNLADISTKIQVNTGAHYGTATDVQNKIDNRGTTDLIDADILAGGKISGTGTTNILGDTVNNSSITQSAVVIAANGSLTTNSQDVNAAVTNDGTLIWNAGGANANVVNGEGTLNITGGTIANTAAISQGKINITGGSLTSDADLLASVGGINNAATLGITGGTNNNVITGTGTTNFSNTVINKAAITQAIVGNSGDFTNNEGVITADIINTGNFLNQDGLITGSVLNSGTLASEGDGIVGAITNTGNYEIITGDNSNNISGMGALYIYGNTKNTGVINQDTLTVDTGASLVATNMNNVVAYSGITNAGVLEMQSGTNNNAISGNTGTVKVTGAVSNTSGKAISQDILEIATLGSFTADASDITTVDGIINGGALTLGNGTTANNISGNGALTVTGTVTNTGNISQKTLSNTGTLTSNADLLAFANGITNTNILNITGGTNANAISGTGTVNLTGDVTNNGVISQANLTNDTGVFTNNAAITAAFANNGGTVNNEAAITGAITNTGTLNSTATNLVGTVNNTGTLNVAGGEVQGAISGTTGVMNITDALVHAQTITQNTVNNYANMTNSGAVTVTTFNNSGILDNAAAITGAINNNGTITSTADNLVGAIANNGTLNVNGGTMQDVVTGTGTMNIITDLTSAYNITQGSVTNDGNFTNNATVSATTITNTGTITGKASDLVASSGITNNGTLVFNAASTGASNISGTGDVQVTANTTLTGSNTFTGGTLVDGSTLTVAGQTNLGTSNVSFANNGVLQVTAAGALSNNLLGQTATDNVRVQNDAALTLNGTIGSAADFHKSGAGTMTFAMASNSYTGDTYVDAGTLVGNTQNINNTVNGAAGTTVEFTNTTDAELNAINTLGNFVQSGNAVLNVSSNAFSAAQADINAGTFAANRALTATALNVNNTATLRGNGNITGTVNVAGGGTIAPGNSIDTLTITGDLNLASGSTTAIEINATPANDKLVVTGNANIASGANLTVANEDGRYFDWESFEIVNASNVAGTFTYDGTISGYDASRINVEADYSDPTKVVLTAKRKATEHENITGLTRNQSEVARAMDAVSTGFGGDITNPLLQLEKLAGLNPDGVTQINPSSTLHSALDDMSGVLYANSALISLFNAKTAHVYDRIAKRTAPATGECPSCHDNVWVEYYGQHDRVFANANSPRFTNNMTGFLVGYDRSSDEVLLGAYGGTAVSNLNQRGDKMDMDEVSFGIYTGYMPDNWTFKGTLFGGHQSYRGKRTIDFMARNANGKYHGMNLALDLEAGYNFNVFDWLDVKPFVGAFGNYVHTGSFTETGADSLNLHVEHKDQFNSQARLGVQFEGKVGKKFNWYTSAAVKQFIGNDYAKLHTSLDLPGTRMEVVSAELGRTYFSGQVGVSYAFTDRLSIFGNVDAGVNNKSANCYGNIGLAYTW